MTNQQTTPLYGAMPRFPIFLTTFALIGCGPSTPASSSASGTNSASGVTSSAAATSGAGGASSSATSSTAGTSTGAGGGSPGQIAGKVGGKAVDKVLVAWLIGKSDDPVNTTVIYVFDRNIPCADISAAGWDLVVPDGTGALEMKLIGTSPAMYPVSMAASPAQGEAVVNFTWTSVSATPKEQASNAGSVQLDTLAPSKHATGSFDLKFSNGTLKGTFSAGWCPTGREP